MKAKELMIGDWVNVFGIPKQMEGIREFRYGAEVVYYDGDNGNFIENLTPIPLTSEILEKNGFENIPYAGIDCNEIWLLHEIAYYGKSFPLYTDDIMLRYSISEQCWFIFFNIGDMHSDFRTITNICYVHELQHLLRLCKIDKKIIL